MKKMCYLLTMGLLAGSLTVPVFAASDAETDKKWTIATDTVFKPFEYTDDSGNFVGIDVDVLDAIAKDQSFEYELKSLGWDASIAACQAGQADGMIAGASITDERKESGEYNEIIAKYLGEDAVPTEEAADDAEADTTEAPAEEEAPAEAAPVASVQGAVTTIKHGKVVISIKEGKDIYLELPI